MENCKKYERQYFMPPKFEYDWVKKDYVDAPPIWCSVDLRDGNQVGGAGAAAVSSLALLDRKSVV